MDSNRRPLASEVSTLPTEPQPLTRQFDNFACFYANYCQFLSQFFCSVGYFQSLKCDPGAEALNKF